jgi:hypothetical protein
MSEEAAGDWLDVFEVADVEAAELDGTGGGEGGGVGVDEGVLVEVVEAAGVMLIKYVLLAPIELESVTRMLALKVAE